MKENSFMSAYRLTTSVCTTKIMLFLSIFQIFNELFFKKHQLFSRTVDEKFKKINMRGANRIRTDE